jgi:hypothetical protein
MKVGIFRGGEWAKVFLSIAAIDQKIEGSRESTEQSKDGLFDTRGITTVAGTALTTLFDPVLPMGAKNDGIFWRVAGVSVHTDLLKLVKLFDFKLVPERPCVQSLEATTSEGGQSTLSRGDGFRLEHRNHEVNCISGKVITINWVGGMKAVDGAQGINGDGQEGIRIVYRVKSGEDKALLKQSCNHSWKAGVVVLGRKPRKIPLRMCICSLPEQEPGGQTQM